MDNLALCCLLLLLLCYASVHANIHTRYDEPNDEQSSLSLFHASVAHIHWIPTDTHAQFTNGDIYMVHVFDTDTHTHTYTHAHSLARAKTFKMSNEFTWTQWYTVFDCRRAAVAILSHKFQNFRPNFRICWQWSVLHTVANRIDVGNLVLSAVLCAFECICLFSLSSFSVQLWSWFKWTSSYYGRRIRVYAIEIEIEYDCNFKLTVMF